MTANSLANSQNLHGNQVAAPLPVSPSRAASRVPARAYPSRPDPTYSLRSYSRPDPFHSTAVFSSPDATRARGGAL